MSRRSALAFGMASGLMSSHVLAADISLRRLPVQPTAAPLQRIAAGGWTGLLGMDTAGDLWALSASGASPQRIGGGLDPQSPPHASDRHISARGARGGLWLAEAGRTSGSEKVQLARHAGLLRLPMAEVCVVEQAVEYRVARLEPGLGGEWCEVARSAVPVLPDARPFQADLDTRNDGGHIVVLGGPDKTRYRHGVLGDEFEATRLLWLDRHRLTVLRAYELPAPFVFEDIAPRLVAVEGRPCLLTVRSGPSGAQLALLAADPVRQDRLALVALGENLGGPRRWMAPTTDGHRMLAVHTPHVGGILHHYWLNGDRLERRSIADDVSTHRIGTRELDLGAWVAGVLVVPSQDRRRLRVFDGGADWAERAAIALPAAVQMTVALRGSRDVAVLLEDGSVGIATLV